MKLLHLFTDSVLTENCSLIPRSLLPPFLSLGEGSPRKMNEKRAILGDTFTATSAHPPFFLMHSSPSLVTGIHNGLGFVIGTATGDLPEIELKQTFCVCFS